MEARPRVIRDDVVNGKGELTFAEQVRMTRGPVWGAERELATPDDDPWYDVPPGPPVLPTLWWQGVHPAHIHRFGREPVPLPEAWYRRLSPIPQCWVGVPPGWLPGIIEDPLRVRQTSYCCQLHSSAALKLDPHRPPPRSASADLEPECPGFAGRGPSVSAPSPGAAA